MISESLDTISNRNLLATITSRLAMLKEGAPLAALVTSGENLPFFGTARFEAEPPGLGTKLELTIPGNSDYPRASHAQLVDKLTCPADDLAMPVRILDPRYEELAISSPARAAQLGEFQVCLPASRIAFRGSGSSWSINIEGSYNSDSFNLEEILPQFLFALDFGKVEEINPTYFE